MAEDQDGGARSAGGNEGIVADRNGEVVRRAIEEIWNHGDLAMADTLFTATYVNHGGLIPDVVLGPEAIRVGVALHRTAYPNLRVTVEHLMAVGEMVAIRWVARSPPPGGADAPAPGGESGQLAGMAFCRLAGGQIAESWTSWDAGAIVRQLVEAGGPSRAGGAVARRVLN